MHSRTRSISLVGFSFLVRGDDILYIAEVLELVTRVCNLNQSVYVCVCVCVSMCVCARACLWNNNIYTNQVQSIEDTHVSECNAPFLSRTRTSVSR